MTMNSYKGYRIYCEKLEDSSFRSKVLGREAARYKGVGKTESEAITNLKKEIDKVRK